jgi:hypothetical protein
VGGGGVGGDPTLQQPGYSSMGGVGDKSGMGMGSGIGGGMQNSGMGIGSTPQQQYVSGGDPMMQQHGYR